MVKKISMKLWVQISIVVLLSVFAMFNTFARLQDVINDFFLKKGAKYSDDIVIIAIDNESIEQMGLYPWDRKVHADLINNLIKGEASIIAFDVIFTEKTNEESDKMLRDAFEKAGNVVLPIVANFSSMSSVNSEGELVAQGFQYPLENLLSPNVYFGHINNRTNDYTALVRRQVTYIHDQQTGELKPSIAMKLYELYKSSDNEGENNNSNIPNKIYKSFFDRPYIYYPGDANYFQYVPYHWALDPEVANSGFFKDKIVLVGLTATGSTIDNYFTPTSGVIPMPGVAIHATILSNLIYNEYKIPFRLLEYGMKLPVVGYQRVDIFMGGFILALSIVLDILINKIKGMSKRIILFTSLVSIFMLGFYVLLTQFNIIFPVVYPLIAIVVLFIFIGYILEYFDKQEITEVFGKYMSANVVEKIIAEGVENLQLGGSKKDITVMFIDIRGFTTIAEKMSPDTIVDMLNKCFSDITDIIFKNGGTLDKYVGDCLMVLFNTPFTQENPQKLAIETAKSIVAYSNKNREYFEKVYGFNLAFGIGIHSGLAVVGNIGSKSRMDYTAIGDTVNIAARLENMAKPNQILISETALENVETLVKATNIGELHVKGREKPIITYEIN